MARAYNPPPSRCSSSIRLIPACHDRVPIALISTASWLFDPGRAADQADICAPGVEPSPVTYVSRSETQRKRQIAGPISPGQRVNYWRERGISARGQGHQKVSAVRRRDG